VKTKAAALIAGLLLGASAFAAPKIERVAVKPNPAQFSGGKAPEVEIAVTISRTRFDSGSCDARVEFGDGQGRSVDFGMAATRTVRHVYPKNGSYTVAARGAGGTPCEGSQQAALTVSGAPEPKKAEPKKAEAKKKPEPKKKAEPKKKPEPKKKAAKKSDKKAEESK
jgi:hypothetical protein